MEYICNRLLVVGSKRLVKQFTRSRWERILVAKHIEIIENSPGRYINQFDTAAPLVEPLRVLSRRWKKLVFLLAWEWEDKRLKGVVKAKAGLFDSCRVEY